MPAIRKEQMVLLVLATEAAAEVYDVAGESVSIENGRVVGGSLFAATKDVVVYNGEPGDDAADAVRSKLKEVLQG